MSVTSVWSNYGHVFMSDDGGDLESCLTCGATYLLVPSEDDPTRGEYTAADGSEPQQCTHNTSMEHGYETETVCNCMQCQ